MLKKIVAIAAVLVAMAGTSTLAGAADKSSKSKGTIVAVAEGVADVKGPDGKMYKVKVVDILGEDPKTGDIVEYEIVSSMPEMPMNVKKQAGGQAPAK